MRSMMLRCLYTINRFLRGGIVTLGGDRGMFRAIMLLGIFLRRQRQIFYPSHHGFRFRGGY